VIDDEEMREWVPIKVAADAVERHVSQIYRWIESNKLATRYNKSKRRTEVLLKAVLRIESDVRPGRPRKGDTSNPATRRNTM
jgi:hypothetical protein